jgi:hypothetical protein
VREQPIGKGGPPRSFGANRMRVAEAEFDALAAGKAIQ